MAFCYCWIFFFLISPGVDSGRVKSLVNQGQLPAPTSSCLYNPCQNGGICYTVSDATASPPSLPASAANNVDCPRGFKAFQQGCFAAVQEKQTRAEAGKYCIRVKASLTGVVGGGNVDDSAKMALLASFSRQQGLVPLESGNVNTNTDLWIKTPPTWTSLNSSAAQLTTTTRTRPSATRSRLYPTQPREPKICYAIRLLPTKTSIVPQPCNLKLPFICEAPSLPPSTSTDAEVHQCQCRLQYDGPWCENKLAAGVGSYGAGLKCADNIVSLSCPRDQRLEIDYAMYGSILNQVNVCTSLTTGGEMANFDPRCSVSNTLIWLKEQCHGRTSCQASVSDLQPNGACPGTPLQLQYRYRCVDQADTCSPGQFYLDGGCFEVFNKFKATWDEARMFCQSYGGELPMVLSLDSETVVTEALTREMSTGAQQSVQVWIGFRHSAASSEVYDDGKMSRLSSNASQGVFNQSFLPSTWQKNLSALLTSAGVRVKRDEVATQDSCLVLTVVKVQMAGQPATTWKLTGCGRKVGWICRFPAGIKILPDAEDDPTGEVAVLHARSVPMPVATAAPPGRVTTLRPLIPGTHSTIDFQQFTLDGSPEGFSTVLPSTVVPPLDLSFPKIKSLPPLKPITAIPNIFPTMSVPSVPDVPQFIQQPTSQYCPQTDLNGHMWQRSVAGTFVVHSCDNGNWTRTLGDDIIDSVRMIVQNIAPEQLHLFDINIAKYPYGFIFWTCVETTSGPQYLPQPGPVTILCDQALLLNVTRNIMPTNAPATSLAEEFENYTASGALNGEQIVRSVDLLSTMMTVQIKQSIAAPRTMDFGLQAQMKKATEDFVDTMTKSVSNMLMPFHRPGWQQLNKESRSGAATGLIKATENSAAMLAGVSDVEEKQMKHNHMAMQVNVISADSMDHGITFMLNDSETSEKNLNGGTNLPYNLIELPLSVRSFADVDGNVRVAFMQYSQVLSSLLSPIQPNNTDPNTVDASMQGMVNTRIMAAGIVQNSQLRQNIQFAAGNYVTLTLAHTFPNATHPMCVFWNMDNISTPFWDSTGCMMVASNDTHTICKCSHLTNFAVLMDLNGQLSNISSANKLALDIISYVGCVISIICLFLCLIIFTFFRQLWCDRVTIHRNLVFCLLIAQFVFVLGVDRVSNQIGCSITAGILHYTLLASFAWMLLEGLQLYMMLVQVFESEESHKVYYYAFGYGFPAIIVAVAAGIRPNHYGTPKYCWLLPEDGFVWSFVGPVALVIGINIMFLIIALMAVFRTKSPRQQNGFEKVRGWLRGSIMLLCLLGTTWLFGLLYINYATTLVFAYIFTIANSLQGLFIFIFHCLMNEKVFSTVQRYIGRCTWCPQWCKNCIGTPKTSSTSGSNSKSSSHSIKEGSHSRHNSTIWNFLKKRPRLSIDSAISLQLPIGKSLYDSDYWSKTSSYKSNRIPYNRQTTTRTTAGDNGSVKSEPEMQEKKRMALHQPKMTRTGSSPERTGQVNDKPEGMESQINSRISQYSNISRL